MILLSFVFVSLVVFGQSSIPEEKPYIEVIGKAKKEVIPNEIYIQISIQERIENKEKITIKAQEADLKKALLSINIPLENLSLSEASSNYQKVKWSKKDVIAETVYMLKVDDAMAVGDVFNQLDALKIVNAHVAKVDHSEIHQMKKEIRIQAIKAAKDKAEYLLAAIDESLGKAIIVREEMMHPYGEIRGARSNAYANYVDGVEIKKGEDFIQYEKIILEASVYVKFAIQ